MASEGDYEINKVFFFVKFFNLPFVSSSVRPFPPGFSSGGSAMTDATGHQTERAYQKQLGVQVGYVGVGVHQSNPDGCLPFGTLTTLPPFRSPPPRRTRRHLLHAARIDITRSYTKSVKRLAPGKAGFRFYRNVGLGFKTPREAIEGPSGGRVAARGRRGAPPPPAPTPGGGLLAARRRLRVEGSPGAPPRPSRPLVPFRETHPNLRRRRGWFPPHTPSTPPLPLFHPSSPPRPLSPPPPRPLQATTSTTSAPSPATSPSAAASSPVRAPAGGRVSRARKLHMGLRMCGWGGCHLPRACFRPHRLPPRPFFAAPLTPSLPPWRPDRGAALASPPPPLRAPGVGAGLLPLSTLHQPAPPATNLSPFAPSPPTPPSPPVSLLPL